MKNFRFHRPQSVAEAVAVMNGAEAGKYLAGGQSLLPVMKLGLAEPTDVIALDALRELNEVRVDGEALVIGALATHYQVHTSPHVNKLAPALADLAGHIGDAQVRNRGTLGGSVAHADPAADYPAALLALDAVVHTDRRALPAEAFFTGLFETALEPDELVTAVRFSLPRKSAYVKFAHRASKYAVVGVMVARLDKGFRVAVTGAGPKAFRLPELEARLAKSCGPDAFEGFYLSPGELNGDHDASAEYRAHLVGVLARRAVAAAA
ncbi:MAG TPA: xanthine dehydrogenase family protein subunit M [Polyangiaceae bacterium]|nr:xanthine dehydrogenase family protein subunit M [Polyangiaceae bacterium]